VVIGAVSNGVPGSHGTVSRMITAAVPWKCLESWMGRFLSPGVNGISGFIPRSS
jgi:hypothetical protein